MKKSFIAIPSIVITTLIYALVATPFFEMDNNNNAYGEEGANFLVDVGNNNDQTTTSYSQQQVIETKECKSPCPSSAEMCITMCADMTK